MNSPIDIFRLMRPKQWIRNAFVFTGFVFGENDNLHLFLQICLIAFSFCFASSSAYIFNDIIDQENDQKHPRKKFRPLPSKKVSVKLAYFISLLLLVLAFLLSYLISWTAFFIILSYSVLNLAYTLRLKQIVIIDVFCIAAGFMLRIFAGTFGVERHPTNWLLLCGLMITLFLGFAKRRAEIITLQEQRGEHRQVLNTYGVDFLDQLISICAGGAIISYSLYTMSQETILAHHTENLIYTVPFVIYSLFRYIFLLHHFNSGGSPTRDIFTDPHLNTSFICWMALTAYLVF
jgi:4-hydroxybenzoate polyprenyltransferase